eukprot:3229762-Rhodomonas_salina.2
MTWRSALAAGPEPADGRLRRARPLPGLPRREPLAPLRHARGSRARHRPPRLRGPAAPGRVRRPQERLRPQALRRLPQRPRPLTRERDLDDQRPASHAIQFRQF